MSEYRIFSIATHRLAIQSHVRWFSLHFNFSFFAEEINWVSKKFNTTFLFLFFSLSRSRVLGTIFSLSYFHRTHHKRLLLYRIFTINEHGNKHSIFYNITFTLYNWTEMIVRWCLSFSKNSITNVFCCNKYSSVCFCYSYVDWLWEYFFSECKMINLNISVIIRIEKEILGGLHISIKKAK